MNLTKLYEKISAVTPIVSVRVGNRDDKSTWEVQYEGEPTPEQLTQVQLVIDSHVALTPVESQLNGEQEAFLMRTADQVSRHFEELHLAGSTTMSEEDFIALLQQRASARNQIVIEG